MIERGHDLAISKQGEVLRIRRGSIRLGAGGGGGRSCDHAASRAAALELPFGGWDVARPAGGRGVEIGRRRVKTLMQRMGMEALYRRPRTTKPEPSHKIYPYLLRGLAITRRPVWAMDITYIAMARGFVYLAVALDGEPPRPGVAAVDYDGGGVLHRDAGGRLGAYGKPEHTTTRLAVHWPNLHRRARRNGVAINMDAKRLARQRVCRAALRSSKRGGVSARLHSSAKRVLRSPVYYFYNPPPPPTTHPSTYHPPTPLPHPHTHPLCRYH